MRRLFLRLYPGHRQVPAVSPFVRVPSSLTIPCVLSVTLPPREVRQLAKEGGSSGSARCCSHHGMASQSPPRPCQLPACTLASPRSSTWAGQGGARKELGVSWQPQLHVWASGSENPTASRLPSLMLVLRNPSSGWIVVLRKTEALQAGDRVAPLLSVSAASSDPEPRAAGANSAWLFPLHPSAAFRLAFLYVFCFCFLVCFVPVSMCKPSQLLLYGFVWFLMPSGHKSQTNPKNSKPSKHCPEVTKSSQM